MTQCSNKRRSAGLAYPRTCSVCGLGPCRETSALNPPDPPTNTVKHTPDATDSIADDLLRNGYERWLRLEEEKAAIGDDLKELFAELKGQGFTPKALRESFRRVRNIGDANQQEHDAIVDLYVASLTRARPARGAREIIEEFPSANLSFSQSGLSYAEQKGRGEVSGNSGKLNAAPETGEITDNQDQIGGNGPDLPVEASTDKQAAGASRPINSNSQASLPPADSAGEAPSSSQASPATLSDDIDLTIPDFLRRTEGGYPKREAVEA